MNVSETSTEELVLNLRETATANEAVVVVDVDMVPSGECLQPEQKCGAFMRLVESDKSLTGTVESSAAKHTHLDTRLL